jgi:hypothetical protein
MFKSALITSEGMAGLTDAAYLPRAGLKVDEKDRAVGNTLADGRVLDETGRPS